MKFSRSTSAGALLASLITTASSLATYSPNSGVSYSVGIPSSSGISASSTGPLYFQLSASTSYQWVGLGIGTRMAGATIFVMYADGTGNVTISARNGGGGHVQPTADSTIQAGVTLLAGSGIVGNQMIANVRCTSCRLGSSASSTSSPWIAAWNQGSAINSRSLSYSINQHSGNSYATVNLDLTRASLSSDTNPFVSASSASTTSRSSTGTRTGTATSSAATPTASSDDSGDDHGGDNHGGSSGSNSGATVVGNSYSTIVAYDKAHGIIMGATMVLLFPLGAISMRLGSSAWMHGAWQLFSLVAMIAGLGVGIKLAQMKSLLFNNTHTIFGIVIVGLFLLQPIWGVIHHIQYKRNLSRAGVSYLHIWYGRILMILGIVNGGLGLQLAANSRKGEIAYGVVAGVVGLVYILLAVFKRKDSGTVPMMMRKDGMVERGDGDHSNGFSSEERHHNERYR